jgi:ketosteroid isomerase-like protein
MSLPTIVADYFRLLAAGDFAAAAACFSPDGFYSHPAYDPGSSGPTGGRLEARGREAIARMFQMRGPRSWTHDVRSDTVGDRFYIEGVACDETGREVLSFLSVGSIDASGLISSYVAYDSRPPVGSTSPS